MNENQTGAQKGMGNASTRSAKLREEGSYTFASPLIRSLEPPERAPREGVTQ